MQVEDRLACASPCVDHGAIAALGEPLIVGDSRSHPQKMAEQRFVLLSGFVERFQVFPWNDEHMNGSLRIDVAKGYAALVLVDGVGRNLTREDATEKTAHTKRDHSREPELGIKTTSGRTITRFSSLVTHY